MIGMGPDIRKKTQKKKINFISRPVPIATALAMFLSIIENNSAGNSDNILYVFRHKDFLSKFSES